MKSYVFAASAVLLLLCVGATGRVRAQSTDGYHTIQVFPVVVDSASFTQRFNFHLPQGIGSTPISATFYPNTQAGAAPVACPDFIIPDSGSAAFNSLRQLCPGVPSGSTFGYLYTAETSPENHPYSGYSRVSNIAGAGFSVEAFPAHTFTSANSVVTGARRLAATATGPAYQTNCFVGNLNDVTPPALALPTQVLVSLYDSSNNQTAGTAVAVFPGQLTRMLDVFSSMNAPAGDIDNATIKFQPVTRGAAIMAFCTVQDNTSFGADFRVAKQERSFLVDGRYAIAGHDDHVTRNSFALEEMKLAGNYRRPFEIGPGNSSNTHIIYFRHPDRIQCELLDLPTGQRLTPQQGLEMRLLADDGTTVVAGGNDVTGFGEIYLGDKPDRNGGANSRYSLEVENNESAGRLGYAYMLHCQSGSGHTLTDLARFNENADRF